MKALILAIATAVPQYSLDQESIAKKISEAFNLTDHLKNKVENLYKKTEIKRRYSVLEDIKQPVKKWGFWGKKFPYEIPGTKSRNDIYIKEAPKLSINAANQVIKSWGEDPKSITHIVYVSCTGAIAPGVELSLQKELGLNPEVERIGINFMGCFGAFKGLAIASSLVAENPDNRVLLVCTELCSLHMQVTFDPEILVANALFSDGAGAVIVGGNKKNQESPIWEIKKRESIILKNTEDKMTWKLSDYGFVMQLSRDIPKIIESNIDNFIGKLINRSDFNKHTFAIHPGGKRILEVIEDKCNLKKDQTRASWSVLQDYGNMSSATFLFVLNELINDINPYVVGLGFGPGLSFEGILLKKLNYRVN